MKSLNLISMKFGRLTVTSKAENKHGKTAWNCLCSCGGKITTLTRSLRNGDTKSCGCLHVENAIQNSLSRANPIGHRRIHKQSGRYEIKTTRGYVREHIHVMEMHIGRRLRKSEVVHHIDHNIHNNELSNLLLMTNSEHTAYHSTGRECKESTRMAIKTANQKYTTEQVHKLRTLIDSGMSQRSAAASINMSQMAASRIARKITYKDI